MAKPKVALFLLGGTIDSLGASSVDHAWYTEAGRRLEPEKLLETVPEIAEIAQIELHAEARVPSYRMSSEDWLNLARRIRARIVENDITGLVITHGTNTLEETAFFLHLVHTAQVPIVITGALRPAQSVGSDGPINLLRAVQVACSPHAQKYGVLAVFNDTIHAPQHLTKASTFRVDAFVSRDAGPLGYVEADGTVRFNWGPIAPSSGCFSGIPLNCSLPRVDVVVSHIDAEDTHIRASLDAGAQGLVVAGTGAGRPAGFQDEALRNFADSGGVVCLATRASGGRVLRSPGMKARGFLTSGSLPSWKAKIVLQLALTAGMSRDDIQKVLDLV